jgi:hypothetical protein
MAKLLLLFYVTLTHFVDGNDKLETMKTGLQDAYDAGMSFYGATTLRRHEDRSFKLLMRILKKARADLSQFENLYDEDLQDWYNVNPNRFSERRR